MNLGTARRIAAANFITNLLQMLQWLDDHVAHDQVQQDHGKKDREDDDCQQQRQVMVDRRLGFLQRNAHLNDRLKVTFLEIAIVVAHTVTEDARAGRMIDRLIVVVFGNLTRLSTWGRTLVVVGNDLFARDKWRQFALDDRRCRPPPLKQLAFKRILWLLLVFRIVDCGPNNVPFVVLVVEVADQLFNNRLKVLVRL